MATYNLKQHLIEELRQGTQMYLGDLGHLPAERLNQVPMGVARTPLAFTAEVAGFNHLLAATLRGEAASMPSAEQRAEYEARFTSHESCAAHLNASVDALVGAIEALSDEEIAAEGAAPWGAQMPRAKIAAMAASHTAYHDGQLNYIQTLYGDAEDHWFGG